MHYELGMFSLIGGEIMPTLTQIQNQIKSLDGTSKFLGRREISELPNILWEDEMVEKIVQGVYSKGNGILVASNKRLIFIDKGLIWGLKVEDFPFDKISSIQYETGMIFGTITIFTSGNRAEIKQVIKDQCRDFCDYVRARISNIKEPVRAPKTANSSQVQQSADDDVISKLERLAVLREKGILNEREFNEQKQHILGHKITPAGVCNHCGNDVKPDWKFCITCGNIL